MSIKCEKVTKDNLKLAIKIQNIIFPTENGALNLKASTNESLVEEIYGKDFRESVDFWICKNEQNEEIGITGIYAPFDYPDDAWCGWFGILPEKTGQKYGEKLFLWTINKAKEIGFKNFRLYTDLEDNRIAVNLYRKIGMIEELYTAENMGDEKIAIFSKSLISNEVEKLGNRNLNLKQQEEIQKRSEKKLIS